jgi:hypothetical protein
LHEHFKREEKGSHLNILSKLKAEIGKLTKKLKREVEALRCLGVEEKSAHHRTNGMRRFTA